MHLTISYMQYSQNYTEKVHTNIHTYKYCQPVSFKCLPIVFIYKEHPLSLTNSQFSKNYLDASIQTLIYISKRILHHSIIVPERKQQNIYHPISLLFIQM